MDYLANMDGIGPFHAHQELEEKFGVSAAARWRWRRCPEWRPRKPPRPKSRPNSNVVLTACGANKIQVIKEVRAVTNLGLKEAKEAVENVPTTLKEAISRRKPKRSRRTGRPGGYGRV